MPDIIHLRDPVHGAISLTPEERDLTELGPMRRLRHIKQLGFSDYAFPSASHSRFSHSLGAMHVSSRMFDAIFAKQPDLPEDDRQKFRQALRLALMLHDIGHAPLSHATESYMPQKCDLLGPHREPIDLGQLPDTQAEIQADVGATHEDYTTLLILSDEMRSYIDSHFLNIGVSADLVSRLLRGRTRDDDLSSNGINYAPLLEHIVSGELDADRIDYLKRDAFFCGVTYGAIDQDWIIENLAAHHRDNKVYLALSHRAVFAFDDFLISRYHMFASIYYHHAATAFDETLKRFASEDSNSMQFPVSADAYLHFDDIFFWNYLRASDNIWAQRVTSGQHFRMLIQTHQRNYKSDQQGSIREEQLQDKLGAICDRLDANGIETISTSSTSTLSRYFKDNAHLFVINEPMGQSAHIRDYSEVFNRYQQPAIINRIYVAPESLTAARAII